MPYTLVNCSSELICLCDGRYKSGVWSNKLCHPQIHLFPDGQIQQFSDFQIQIPFFKFQNVTLFCNTHALIMLLNKQCINVRVCGMITNKTSVTSIMERKRFGISHRKQQVRISHSRLPFSYRSILAKVTKG